MVEVPSVGCQTAADRVHDGVLHNVHGARHASGEEALGPARQPVGLGEEPSGEEPVVCGHLAVHDVLRENVSAGQQR